MKKKLIMVKTNLYLDNKCLLPIITMFCNRNNNNNNNLKAIK